MNTKLNLSILCLRHSNRNYFRHIINIMTKRLIVPIIIISVAGKLSVLYNTIVTKNPNIVNYVICMDSNACSIIAII